MADEVKDLTDNEIYLKSKISARKIPERRDDLLNGRFYQYENQFKRSWTTIYGETMAKGIGFNMWLGNARSYKEAMEYGQSRADLGSRLHTIFAHLIWGAEISLKELETEEIKRIMEFVQFWKQAKPVPLATEYPLWVDEIPYAGTADLICDIVNKKGVKERWLLDFKTGEIYDEPFQYQLSAYKYLAEKIFNFKIDKIAIVQVKGAHRGTCNVDDKPKYRFKVYDVVPYEEIMYVYKLWERKGIKPRFPEEFPKTISLTEIKEEEKDE